MAALAESLSSSSDWRSDWLSLEQFINDAESRRGKGIPPRSLHQIVLPMVLRMVLWTVPLTALEMSLSTVRSKVPFRVKQRSFSVTSESLEKIIS